MELVLIRHAEPCRVTTADTAGAAADPGLTARGRDQARRLAQWLAAERVDALLVSPKRRALETAAPLADLLGLPAVIDESIVEYDAHADQYIPMEELRATGDPRLAAMAEGRWAELGGEEPDVFRGRLVRALDAIVAEHPAQRVAAVCHGGVINVMLAIVLGLDRELWFDPGYTSVSRLAAARTGVRSIVSVNETGHLHGARTRG